MESKRHDKSFFPHLQPYGKLFLLVLEKRKWVWYNPSHAKWYEALLSSSWHVTYFKPITFLQGAAKVVAIEELMHSPLYLQTDVPNHTQPFVP